MNQVLDWIKSNVFIVVFSVLMIAAMVTLPFLASGMNQEVADEVERRARKLNELKQLESTQVAPPGSPDESQATLVNERLIDQYRESVRIAQDDADLVLSAAMAHNQKGRSVLLDQVFPEPPSNLAEVMPRRFHERVMQAYDDLLAHVGAGSPPALESLREEIERREVQFRTHTLSKDVDDPLTEQEQRELDKVLGELRVMNYQMAAERHSMFLTLDALQLPQWEDGSLPSLSQMYMWQWNYWVHEDVLAALRQANSRDSGDESGRLLPVLAAPVKHVKRITVSEQAPPSNDASGGGSTSASVGAVGGRSVGGGQRGGQRGGGGSGAVAPDPRSEASLDYSVSFTGRVTNPLYDVRYVDMELVLDTARIPQVIDALARRNFMTVIDVRMTPADPYEAAAGGFFYGSDPVSNVSIRLETVWFRQWTSEFMPDSLKQDLGIPVEDDNNAG